jgi:ankyrin repeat protein
MTDIEALIEAAKTGDVGLVQEILDRDPRLASQRLATGESPLMAALYRGQHSVVDLLVQLGAEVDVFAAAATGRLNDLNNALAQPDALNACSYDGWTPLHLASFFGQLAAVRKLLSAGADIHAVSRNSLGNTALHAATAGKHSDVALLLLESGADDLVPDAGGHTANRIASENKLTAVVEAMAARPR